MLKCILKLFSVSAIIIILTNTIFCLSDSTVTVDSTYLSDKVEPVDIIKIIPTEYPVKHPLKMKQGEQFSEGTINGPIFTDTNSKAITVDPFRTDINYTILTGLGIGYIGAAAYLHIYQANAWWADDRTKFHFTNDWNYALAIDKVGHFYATNLLAHAFSGAFDASNVQAEQSAIFSALAAFSFEVLVEYEDGYGKDWGFSPGDFAADFTGALFYVGQYYYPFLKNFQPRFSYIPTETFKNDPKKIIIDDYEGQKYWISMRVKNFLPEKAAEYWPGFINLSAGMGVRNLDGGGGGQREFYLALDLDAEELIPFNGPFWNFVKNSLNYFHFPLPGIRITPDAAFFAIVF